MLVPVTVRYSLSLLMSMSVQSRAELEALLAQEAFFDNSSFRPGQSKRVSSGRGGGSEGRSSSISFSKQCSLAKKSGGNIYKIRYLLMNN